MEGFCVRKNAIKSSIQELETQKKILKEYVTTVQNIKRGLRGKVVRQEELEQRLTNIINAIDVEVGYTSKMSDSLEKIWTLYEKTDNKIAGNETYSEIETDDILSILEQLLKKEKWEGNKEAGVLNDILSYIESFSTFFSEDKTGYTGASNWFDLADTSISTWKSLYDYFLEKYKGVKTGFFGEIAQKQVKVLGLSANFLGLISSVLSASDGLDSKQWQSIVADYVDSGKDILSIIKSGYQLKHIGDVNSLLKKEGAWNALGVYLAIGEAGIQSVSQGFRSYEKYYEDGQWDIGDTGMTGIDIATAGIYGLGHSLSFGLDDVIFGALEEALGGKGKTNMSYYQQAAEGYKILANKCGDAIAKWWMNLTR